MKSEIRKNAGYEIINKISLPDEEIVLGKKEKEGREPQYVTWAYVGGCYYHGHYMNNYETALKDMYERARSEIEYKIHSLDTPF